MNLKTILGNQSPTILASLGVAGFITAVVMAARATPKAVEVLDEHLGESNFEKAKAVAPIYAHVGAMCLLSTACVVGSNHIQRYRYAALLTVYSLGLASLSRWQESIINTVGEKKYEEIREEVVAPRGPIPGNLTTDTEKVKFFDYYSGRYFHYRSVEDIRAIINDINEKLYHDDFVPVNDFYHSLGLDPIQIGDEVGWIIGNGSITIQYDSRIHEDIPCITLSFDIVPREY